MRQPGPGRASSRCGPAFHRHLRHPLLYQARPAFLPYSGQRSRFDSRLPNCAMSQVYWALDRGRLSYGEKLLVLGAGGLGLHAMAIAKARGARVIAIDGVELRLAHAKAFGAAEVIDIRQYPDAK